jgi:hypothetical protein
MANRPRKSPQTEIDLVSIWNFIATDSLKAADALLERIEEAFDMFGANAAGRSRTKRFSREAAQLSCRKLCHLLPPGARWHRGRSGYEQSAGYRRG